MHQYYAILSNLSSSQNVLSPDAVATLPHSSGRMGRAAIVRRLFASFSHRVIAGHSRDAQAIVSEDTIPSRRLRGAMIRMIAPLHHSVLIAPKRKR